MANDGPLHTPTSRPQVGELWRSLDPRDVDRGRRVRIEGDNGEFIHVQSFLNGKIGRRSRIHVSRFDGKQFERMERRDGSAW